MIKIIIEWFSILIVICAVVYLITSIYSGTFIMSGWEKETRETAAGIMALLGAVNTVINLFRAIA